MTGELPLDQPQQLDRRLVLGGDLIPAAVISTGLHAPLQLIGQADNADGERRTIVFRGWLTVPARSLPRFSLPRRASGPAASSVAPAAPGGRDPIWNEAAIPTRTPT